MTGHDPGGLVRRRLPPDITTSAQYAGDNDCYRLRLTRRWGDGDAVLVIMMNPSTATEDVDDPTVAKVTTMARHWSGGRFGKLLVGNVFAYRATDQAELMRVPDPIGPGNNDALIAMASRAQMVVMAYGTPKAKALRQRGPAVADMLLARGHRLFALQLSKQGIPWHPLYLPNITTPTLWKEP